MHLGGGRTNPNKKIDHAVGIELKKKSGQHVRAGEPLGVLHYNGQAGDLSLADAKREFAAAFTIDDRRVKEAKLIYEILAP